MAQNYKKCREKRVNGMLTAIKEQVLPLQASEFAK
jgi:hypothetical protein